MDETSQRILGIDPGLTRTGYGIIDINSGQPTLVKYGAITNKGSLPLSEKLLNIYKKLTGLINEYTPMDMAIEEVFFSNNPQSALKLGHARAAALLAGIHGKMKIYEYSALEVKKSITSYGRATKEQIQSMVTILLRLKSVPKPCDSADALAIALCHFHNCKFRLLTETVKLE